ncbi:hypothetical protein M427DRAFT_295367 [Gonapodya prolifera JEL478]|uniref:Uncharacterized protein n=1 Tax=Gonapodya prolifera (strain JEL478) TaxID=1344416 RepID=A0A139AHG3_GONPJ|nr:hypothetical protein M427DRAFT_295367 [Gonapodya prolifera JEL478]|eukprot:KXS16261.1 hypothetical protein M427DRAFT_295367 [Gonapodya prolifera JEL478]
MVWKKTKETSKPLSFETEWSDVTLAPHGVIEISLHHKSSPETEQAKRRYQIAPNTNNPPQHAHMWTILRMPSEYTGILPPRAGTLTLFTQNHGLGCRIEIEAFPRWERHGNRSADARFWKFRIRMVSSDNGGPAYLLAETHYVDVKTERNPGTFNRNPKIKEESITRASSMSAPYTLSPPLGRSSKPSPGSSSRPLSTDMRLGSEPTILQSPDSMQSPESMSEATLRDFANQIRSGASDGSSTFIPLLNVDPNAARLGVPTLTNVTLGDPQLLQMAAPSFPQMMDPSWGLAGLPTTTVALSVNEAQRTDDVAVEMVNSKFELHNAHVPSLNESKNRASLANLRCSSAERRGWTHQACSGPM